MSYTEQDLEGLTDAEREALNEDDGANDKKIVRNQMIELTERRAEIGKRIAQFN